LRYVVRSTYFSSKIPTTKTLAQVADKPARVRFIG
jgi:hypothetical protein